MQDKNSIQGTLQLSLAMVISGTIGFFVIESGQNSINVVFFRCLIGGTLLFTYILYKNLLKKNISQEKIVFFYQ